MTESVEVTAEAASVFNPSNTGPTSNVSQEAIENLPTVGRGLDDFARLNPYFATDGHRRDPDATASRWPAATTATTTSRSTGRSTTTCSALAASGAPGGQADTQPIPSTPSRRCSSWSRPTTCARAASRAAASTPSPAAARNEFSGTGVLVHAQQGLRGRRPRRPRVRHLRRQAVRRQPGRAHQEGQGVLLRERRLRPARDAHRLLGRRQLGPGLRPRGGGAAVPQHPAGAATATTPATSAGVHPRPRTTTRSSAASTSTSASSHRLTLRHNYVEGRQRHLRHPATARRFNFPDHSYQFNSKTNSTVAQLNSTFGSRLQRAARHLPAHPRDPRPRHRLPAGAGAAARRRPAAWRAREQFSAANALDQDIIELTDDFTFTRGNAHASPIGHPQRVLQVPEPLHPRQLRHLPVHQPRPTSRPGLAQQYDYSFSPTGDPQQAARVQGQPVRLLRGRPVARQRRGSP